MFKRNPHWTTIVYNFMAILEKYILFSAALCFHHYCIYLLVNTKYLMNSEMLAYIFSQPISQGLCSIEASPILWNLYFSHFLQGSQKVM